MPAAAGTLQSHCRAMTRAYLSTCGVSASHGSEVFAKLDVRDRAAAVGLAYRQGIGRTAGDDAPGP